MDCKNETLKPYQLMGAVQMYGATGEDEYKEYVMAHLSRLKTAEGMTGSLPEQDYPAYFFALDQTGHEKYRHKIEDVMKTPEWTLELMPFITAYDTRYKRKEHYNDIVVTFRKKGKFTGKDMVLLIDTIAQMSEEIYEYYRELRDLFKVIVKEKMKDLPHSSEMIEIGYSILKACNIGVLQKEKYGNFGELVWKTIAGIDNKTGTGLNDMICAQHIIFNKQEV
ncbi:hypothetical protein [Lacrimispora sp.]|uniref:hypothetical protein n=1 Tax=Lacrimispora sp. TaxID=2719234 RepID=UPI003217789D